MSDLPEKLARSSTFVMRSGTLELLPEEGFSQILDFSPGTILDAKYKLIELIGTGGMGAVYKVHHLALQKDMALKTFRSHSLSPDSWHRFQREARAIARLHHNNIVQVFDFGIVRDNRPYYTMELLNGESLAERLKRKGRMEPIKVLHIFLQAAEALAYAHRQQIVHRDIKPANIFLQKQQDARGTSFHVKLVDFGIAKLTEDSSPDANQTLTQSGTVFGSPLYMSPEQSLGQPVDQRTDIYSFGCALFESLVGHAPFTGETVFATLIMHQTKTAPSLKEALPGEVFPQRIQDILKKLLAKKADRRYQSFEEVISEIKYAIEDLSASPAYSTAITERERTVSNQLTGQTTIAVRLIKRNIIIGAAFVFALTGLVATALLNQNASPTKEIKNQPRTIDAQTLSPTDGHLTKDSFQPDRIRASKDTAPYYQGITKGQKIFRFPDYRSIGTIYLSDKRSDPRPCIRTVKIPQDAHITFVAESEVFLAPELLDRFGADDLYGLQLPAEELAETLWRNDQLSHISRLKSLRVLNLAHNGDLDNGCIRHINDLSNLISLDVSSTLIDGNGLTRLKNLPQITSLSMSESRRADALLKCIGQAPEKYALKKLTANHCDIKDDELRNLGRLKYLSDLSVSNNVIHGSSFRYLANLSSLRSLGLEKNDIAPTNILALARMSDLKTLLVTEGRVPPGDIEKLRRLLPKCAIFAKAEDAHKKEKMEALQ